MFDQLIITPYTIIFFMVFSFRNVVELKNKPRVQPEGQGSGQLSLLVFSLGYFISALAVLYFLLKSYPESWIFFLAGNLFFLVFFLWRTYVVQRILKEDYQYVMEPLAKSTLRNTGVYGVIRHPLYLFFLVELLSLYLVFPNWISLGVFVANVIATVTRIRTEEKFLMEKFGKQYGDYRKKTKKLIPFIY